MSDTNPYQAPEASLEVSPSLSTKPPKKHILWKVFFFLMLAGQLFSWIFSIYDLSVAQTDVFASVMDLVVYPFMIAGLYGYIFQKRIYNRNFWRRFFIGFVVIDIYQIIRVFVEVINFESGISMMVLPFVILIILPFMYFTYLALYRYAYKDVFPWITTVDSSADQPKNR